MAEATDPHERRKHALDAFLEEKLQAGFRIETRTDTHAIIAPGGGRLWSRLRRGDPGRRHVVEVDEHGVVTMSPAEPLRH
jgi:hypothetical protein